MAEQSERSFNIGRPSPDRHRARLLWMGILLAPTAWIVQLLVTFELSNRLCRDQPQATGAPDWLGTTLTIVNVVALLLAAVGIWLSWQNLRRTHRSKPGTHGVLGSGGGRTRLLAAWGALSGLLFLCAIGFNTFSLYLVPLCRS